MEKGKNSGLSPVLGSNQQLLHDISGLREAISLDKIKNMDSTMDTMMEKEQDISLVSPVMNMKCRKILKGHRGRILHFDWSADQRHVITAGQDGYAIIWNGHTGHKEILVQTTSPWVFACAYSPSTTMVACGGLENQCSIYKVDGRYGTDEKPGRISVPNKTVAQHTKYISQCAFFGSDQQLLTSSADSTCALWDLERKEEAIQRFLGHKKEVLGMSVHPRDPYTVFASGGCDGSTRIWDVRTGHCEMKYDNQESEVNAVRFFPSGDAVASAGNNGVIHLYDLRADQEIKQYSKASVIFGASSVDFSKSGRVMFVGYDDYAVRAWDVFKGTHVTVWLQHTDRVSHVLLSPDGTAIGSSSWDGTLKIMA